MDYYTKYDIKIPIATMSSCCANYQNCATWRARGYEAYGFGSWEDAITRLRILRARKALRDTKVLLATRGDSTHSLTVTEGFLCMEEVTRRLGTRFRYINVHELLDQTQRIPCDQNHTLPGKRMHNINSKDDTEINDVTDGLIGDALECTMSRDMVKRSVDAWYTVQKLLEANQCNAFTMPCADVCATRRYNEEKFTMCLTHSLNNERGICSACEYDVPGLLSMVMLSALSDTAPYLGNTAFATPIEDGSELNALFDKDLVMSIKDEIDKGNVFYTFHSVPNRKLHGFDSKKSSYGIRPFAAVQRFGTTIRYDFNQDKGQVITMCRIDPTCTKLTVARGTIVGGVGYESENCSEGVFFSLKNPKAFLEGCYWTGIHVPLVYGDCYDELIELGKLLGFEVFAAE